MKKFRLVRKDSDGTTTVVAKSDNLSYLNRRMGKLWDDARKDAPDKERCFFVNDYASIKGVCSWSIVQSTRPRYKIEDLDINTLWALREEIVLNSLFLKDYNNSFQFSPESVRSFFDGYVDFLLELAKEDGKTEIGEYDTMDNLFTYYWNCDDYSWFKYEPEWTEEEEEEYASYYNGE
jgi:hypothetical protein